MAKRQFNYSKLKGLITEKCGTQKAFADLLGINESTLTGKLRGKTYFSQEEIYRAIDILEIDHGQISQYFFAA